MRPFTGVENPEQIQVARWRLRSIAAPSLLIALIAFGSTACTRDGSRSGSGAPLPATTEALLAELQEDRARIDQTTDQMFERIEAFNRSRDPGQPTLQFSEVFGQDLSNQQRDVLDALVGEEEDVSYKALLERIIVDRDHIRTLQERVLKLEQALPDRFTLVKRGDTHYGLALAYLKDEAQLQPDRARSILARHSLSDELLPGNKAWFLYDADQQIFRTYVTRGEAGRTPLAVRRAVKRQLIAERDGAHERVNVLRQTSAELQATNTTLETAKARLEEDVRDLRRSKERLESSIDRLSRDLAHRENSLYYHAANVDDLKDQGVLSSILKRVRDLRGVEFDEALDLRQGTTIDLNPWRFGLDRIGKVRVLPSIYREGRDFTVETSKDRTRARIVILEPDLFRGKEVLLAVGG